MGLTLDVANASWVRVVASEEGVVAESPEASRALSAGSASGSTRRLVAALRSESIHRLAQALRRVEHVRVAHDSCNAKTTQ